MIHFPPKWVGFSVSYPGKIPGGIHCAGKAPILDNDNSEDVYLQLEQLCRKYASQAPELVYRIRATLFRGRYDLDDVTSIVSTRHQRDTLKATMQDDDRRDERSDRVVDALSILYVEAFSPSPADFDAIRNSFGESCDGDLASSIAVVIGPDEEIDIRSTLHESADNLADLRGTIAQFLQRESEARRGPDSNLS